MVINISGIFRFKDFIIYISYFWAMKKGSKNSTWSEEEDLLITEFVKAYGTKNWAKIAEQLDNNGYKKKTGKQCRERWHNHLDPNIVKKGWSAYEEEIMFEQHKKHGNKWTLIASSLPGRTDNSIKNHFYSTIRRSMRRMNKLLGSKNSTMKMRKIKPSTLSKIFSLAEGRPDTDGMKIEQGEVSEDLHDTCRQILGHLMEFAKLKPSKNDEPMSYEDIQKFQKVMVEMLKINQLYEDEKARQAKQKRQRKLEKNFDEAMVSQQDSQMIEQQDDMDSLQNVESFPSQHVQRTRSNRKVKPPPQYPQIAPRAKKEQLQYNIQVQAKRNEYIPTTFSFDLGAHQLVHNDQMQIIPEQQLCSNQDGKKSQFHLDLEEENLMQMDNLNKSPNLRNTPFALTPTQGLFPKQFQCIPIKTEDCNAELNRLIMRIQKNSQNPGSISKRTQSSFQSPSSAFRQYS